MLRRIGGAGAGTSLLADKEFGAVLAVGGDADVDPVLDEEPDVDLESVESEHDDEPVADPDASVVDERWHLAAWRLLVRGSHARWDTPRGRYDEYSNKFSLRKKPSLSNQ